MASRRAASAASLPPTGGRNAGYMRLGAGGQHGTAEPWAHLCAGGAGPLARRDGRRACKARVQGTRPQPYKVTIKLKPLSDRQWDKVIDALAGQALFAAQLLAGEMPQEIDAVFAAAGCSLFPPTRRRAGDRVLVPGLGQPLQARGGHTLHSGRAARRGPVPALPAARAQPGTGDGGLAGAAQRHGAGGGGAGRLWRGRVCARRWTRTWSIFGVWVARRRRKHAHPGEHQAARYATAAAQSAWVSRRFWTRTSSRRWDRRTVACSRRRWRPRLRARSRRDASWSALAHV